jgi:hypothetical protein
MAQGGLEPSTCCLGGSRSIQLSYWVPVNQPAIWRSLAD